MRTPNPFSNTLSARLCTKSPGIVGSPARVRPSSRGRPGSGPAAGGMFWAVGGGRGHPQRDRLGPEGVAHTGQDIGEGRDRFGVPGGAAGTQGPVAAPAVGDQNEPAEEAQQGGCGAGNGRIGPLTLGLHPQMGAHFRAGNFHRPALPVPGQDGGRGQGRVGAEQGLGLLTPAWVAQAHPAQPHGGRARVIPEGRAGRVWQVSLGAVRPARGQGGPDGGGGGQDPRQGREAGAHPAGTSRLARSPRRRRVMEHGLPPPPREKDKRRPHPLASGQPFERGVGAVSHDHPLPVGEPAAPHTQHLAGPVGDRLVAAAPFCRVAAGGRPYGQEGPRPDPGRPGHVRQPHQAHPAPPLGLNEVAVRGAYRVPVHPQGRDLLPPAPCPSLIHDQPDRPSGRDQVPDPQTQPHPAHRQGGPDRPVEDLVVPGKIGPLWETQHIQGGGYRTLARGQNDSDQQDLDLAPGPGIEERGKGRQTRYNRGWQVGQDGEPLCFWFIIPSCLS